MSGADSDEFPEFSFSFTEQDLAKLDATVASAFEYEHDAVVDAPSAEVHDAPSEADTILLENMDEHVANSSFASDTFDLNLGALSAEELNRLDAGSPLIHKSINDGPYINIEIEDASSLSTTLISPLKQFRSHMSLSVTDLCSPAWCEVQYDYGLRGRRSRPVTERPKSFVSSSGKTISPAVTVAKKNEITTRQGSAVHKELEREIKFEELQVEITTPETRWALRLVNMLACLRGILGGFTREMPVFGILHDEVVVGIMDEVTKVETPINITPDSPGSKQPKRPSDNLHSSSSSKRSRTDLPASQTPIDRFFESPKKSKSTNENPKLRKQPSTSCTLFIKDNKTRRSEYIPSDADMYSGRIQLMIYRRLLSELLATNPPYNFRPLWDKLGLDSSKVFPTKFLVQARLIEESDHFKTACLDDLVDLWHDLVKESNVVGVSPVLELIYRLRPAPEPKRKQRVRDMLPTSEPATFEDTDLAAAIAASLSDVRSSDHNEVSEPSQNAGPSNIGQSGTITPDKVAEILKDPTDELSDLEDAQLQWALQQSILPISHSPGSSSEVPALKDIASALAANLKSKGVGQSKEETGICRFKIIGTKSFLHNDKELDIYLAQVLMWWRGDRRPAGVSLEHSYRCSTCEYANDCEWRAEKALEHSKRKK